MIKKLLILLSIILSIILSPETAIIILRKTGRHFLLTLFTTGIVSCLSVLLTYGIFSGIFWFFGYFLNKISFSKDKKRKSATRKRFQRIRVVYAIIKRALRRGVNGLLHDNQYFIQHFILIFLNLIPLPLLTTATVLAIKISKLKNGIYSILIGNFLKILTVTTFSYYYL